MAVRLISWGSLEGKAGNGGKGPLILCLSGSFSKKIQVGLCNCVHVEIDFTGLKLDSRWLLPVTQQHSRGQLRLQSTETLSQTNQQSSNHTETPKLAGSLK